MRNLLTALSLIALTFAAAPVQARENSYNGVTSFTPERINRCLARQFSLTDDKTIFRSPKGMHGEETYTVLRFAGEDVRFSYTLHPQGGYTSVTEQFPDSDQQVYRNIQHIMKKCLFR